MFYFEEIERYLDDIKDSRLLRIPKVDMKRFDSFDLEKEDSAIG